jgi:hypothetical protein
MAPIQTNKQAILNIFDHKKIDHIVFSPRIYYWYLGNKLFLKRLKNPNRSIPDYFVGKSQMEIYRMLSVSPRYVYETLYFDLIETKIDPESNIIIKRKSGSKEGETIVSYKTPLGNLKQVESVGGGLGAHPTEYPIKSLDDIKIMEYILENTYCSFSNKNFIKAERQFRDLGVVSTYLSHSPFQKLITELMGFSRTILFLKRYPRQIENFMNVLEDWDDLLYREIIHTPIKIINFGENIDGNLSPPHYFEKYLIPYYQKRVKQIHQSDKFCHIHIDGSLRDLLPFLEELPFDGIEALTAYPQGDVSLQEIKDSIGNKILLDGIPSVLFLPQYSNDYVKSYTKDVIELFYPNLILGVSDELSPNGEISKIELIADIVRNYADKI